MKSPHLNLYVWCPWYLQWPELMEIDYKVHNSKKNTVISGASKFGHDPG